MNNDRIELLSMSLPKDSTDTKVTILNDATAKLSSEQLARLDELLDEVNSLLIESVVKTAIERIANSSELQERMKRLKKKSNLKVVK